MKKFGRKLVLSGLALAATAATLSTSTYAWYVTNTTADVDGGTAGTAGTSISGNLLVAQDVEGVAGAYSNKISLEGTYTQSPRLNPVTKNEDSTTGWINVDGEEVETTAAYQEVSFWVLSTDATEVNVATTIANATTSFVDQRLLNATGKPTGAEGDLAINSTFHKDAVEALRFEVLVQGTSVGVFDAKGMYADYATKAGCATGGDANAYYAAVMGGAPVGGVTVEAPTEAFNKITVVAAEETKVTIRIWLEGTDADCFDSCIGQDVTFSFDLTI